MGKSKGNDPLNAYARYSSIAIQMFAIIAVGTYLGVKLDEWYPNKHRAFTIIFALCAVILSVVFVIRRIITNSKKEENESKL
ncbi:MAG: F0F1-type ATP synthase assembly protein I [Flavobacteriales bacterium]|jgi:F0F1-type ATP synthase assembly protein I